MTKPAIYYDNRFADATPTASSTAAGTAVANLGDFRPYTWWRPTAMPATVTVDCGSAKAADYALIYGHDLGSTGHRIQVRGSTDNFASSDVLLASQGAGSDAPLLVRWTSAAYRHWRLRVAAANLLLFSEELDNAAWTKGRSSVTANAAVAPDGSLTADKIVEDTTASNSHFIQRSSGLGTIDAAAPVCASGFFKAGERRRVQLWFGSSSPSLRVTADLIDGVITNQSPIGTATITSAGCEAVAGAPGWYRVHVAGTMGTTAAQNVLVSLATDAGSNSYTGDGTSGLFAWGLQTEDAFTPGPYVRTTADLTSGIPSIAIAAIGSALELPTWLPQGFDPTGRHVEGAINRNANGQPLGRVVDYERWQQDIRLQSVSWSWLRNTLLPAWRAHLRGSPFGFCWNPVTHADEVRLVVADGDLETPHSAGSLADVTLRISGVVE